MLDKLFNLCLLLGLAALCALTYFFNPSTDKFFPPCPTNAVTDLYCPGCGTLRALHALTHGNIEEAISQNLMAVIFLPLLVIMIFFPRPFAKPIVPFMVLVIFVVFTILRNMEQFSCLAPH